MLSPILYAIYTNTICDNINREITVLQFADDIAMYIRHFNRENNRIVLQEAVNKMGNNLEMLGLNLEPRKTSLVKFSNKGVYDEKMCIKIKGAEVKNSKQTKFLGIWLDNKLSFKKYYRS